MPNIITPILYHPDTPDSLQPAPTDAIRFKLQRHGYLLLKVSKIRSYLNRAYRAQEFLSISSFLTWLQNHGVPASTYQLRKFLLNGDDSILTIAHIQAIAAAFGVTVADLHVRPKVSRTRRREKVLPVQSELRMFRAILKQGEQFWIYEGFDLTKEDFIKRVQKERFTKENQAPLLQTIIEIPLRRSVFRRRCIPETIAKRYIQDESY